MSDRKVEESGSPMEEIAGNTGILALNADPAGGKVSIDYDPSRVSENELRDFAEGLMPVMSRLSLRLDAKGGEAAAWRFERKVEKIPGVRRATATYLGKVLCLTFDARETAEENVIRKLDESGAKVSPLEFSRTKKATALEKLKAGEWNEEISCGLGLVMLVAAWTVEKSAGRGTVSLVLFGLAYLFAGQEGLRSALASLKEKVLDVDVLMVLAAIGAAIIGAPFEGALLLFLFSFSNVLQRHAMGRTQKAIESLLTLRPDEVNVKTPEGVKRVPVDSLVPGDVVIVRPGELIASDGTVVEGSTQVNEASLTGESMPVDKTGGSPVFAGTLNQSGAIEIKVTKAAGDSSLAKMVKLVAEAQAEKSTAQRFLERAEQYYAMGVIAFTVLVFLIPWIFMGESFGAAFYRAMTIMVVASPCALVISTPATVLSAIGGAARKGILIKGGSHLERAAHIDIVAVDKTGTLTVGKPAVTEIVTADGVFTKESALPEAAAEWLRRAAALEAKSEHPLGTAIVAKAKESGGSLPEARDFQSVTGKGAEATVDGMRLVIGSERMLREMQAEGMAEIGASAGPLLEKGRTCVWLGVKEGSVVKVTAVFALADTLRTEAAALAKELHHLGVKEVIMLTGDHRKVAEAIGREAGVDEIHAELLPADKLRVVRELKKRGSVMMVGDGVNDAPALAAADLGVAMGAVGTDVAMETADVVLMGDRLENIAIMLAHARKARTVLIQNLTFAGVVIVALIAVTLGLHLPLPFGVIGHEGSTVLVCLNGLRLLVMGRGPAVS